MERSRFRNPSLSQLEDARPRGPAFLTPSAQSTPPERKHPIPKHPQTHQVSWYRVVVEVALHDRLEPLSGLGHGIVHTRTELLLKLSKFRSDALAYRGVACFGKTRAFARTRVIRALRRRGVVTPSTTAGHESPREEWIEIPVPALVSEESFARAQELLQENKIRLRRRTIEPSIVQGLELAHISKGIERLLSAYQEALMSMEQLRERMPALRQREQALRAELQAIADRANDHADPPTWRRPSPRSSSGSTVLLIRSVSLNASASSASW
jgi:hypothetical protein